MAYDEELATRSYVFRSPIPGVVTQHVEEAAHLRQVRSTLLRAPHVGLLHLGRLDERIAAHLEGVELAGRYGVSVVRQALAQAHKGALFVATVRAIEDRAMERLDKLLMVAQALPASRAGAVSAFGWVTAGALRGITKDLLESPSPWRREVGLAACAMHGVDPGPALADAIRDGNPALRACALRVAGRSGRSDLAEACMGYITDPDWHCAFEASRSALMLGDRAESVDVLEALTVNADTHASHRSAALCLVLRVVSPKRAQKVLASLIQDASSVRTVIRGAGIAGDPAYVPWLLSQMEDPRHARLAGEALGLMVGLDISNFESRQKPPAIMGSGDEVESVEAMDAVAGDDGLPWPDTAKLTEWWKSNARHFTAGRRHFMGQAPTPETCTQVLASGTQRQRHLAAEYLTLLTPGTPLFNTCGPTWRQQRGIGKRIEAMQASR